MTARPSPEEDTNIILSPTPDHNAITEDDLLKLTGERGDGTTERETEASHHRLDRHCGILQTPFQTLLGC